MSSYAVGFFSHGVFVYLLDMTDIIFKTPLWYKVWYFITEISFQWTEL